MKRTGLMLIVSVEVPEPYIVTMTTDYQKDGYYRYGGHLVRRSREPIPDSIREIPFEFDDLLQDLMRAINERIRDAVANATGSASAS